MMARRCSGPHARGKDRGFTLVELLIVMSVLGLIVTSLAGAFIVIVRTTPSTELRIEDSRSTRGLATWLSHDTTSTPPYSSYNPQGWIDLSPSRNECGGEGENVLHLTWVENTTSATTYNVSYRYVPTSDGGTIARYSCATNGSSGRINLTAGLATKPSAMLNFNTAGDVESVDLVLTAPSGKQVVVQTGSRNPMEFFS